jgi:hypothetical protein
VIMNKMQGSLLGAQQRSAAAAPLALRPRVARSARASRAAALVVRAEAKHPVAKVRGAALGTCGARGRQGTGGRGAAPDPAAMPCQRPPPPHPALPQWADSIGLPTDEGIFGFRPFAEVGARCGGPPPPSRCWPPVANRARRGLCVRPAAPRSPSPPALPPPPPCQTFCGRLAMMGFVISIVEEAATGRGTLGQLGIDSPSMPLTIGLSSLALLATVVRAPAAWLPGRLLLPGSLAAC